MQLVLDRESAKEIAVEIVDLMKTDREIYNIFKGVLKQEKPKDTRITTWVDIKELQKRTGWGRSKLEAWRKAGKFQYTQPKKNGKVLYNLEDVNRFLRKNELER